MTLLASPDPFPVVEPSQVGEARRQILALAQSVGLDADQQGRLALVVNELGTNLVKHGGGGHLIARAPEGAPALPTPEISRTRSFAPSRPSSARVSLIFDSLRTYWLFLPRVMR